MASRPIRELIKSQVFCPIDAGTILKERRSNVRFKCRLPAVLHCGPLAFPVECVDISDGGIRISTQWPIRVVTVGQQVDVEIRVGAQKFADSFTVMQMSRSNQGSVSMHFHLRSEEPVTADNS